MAILALLLLLPCAATRADTIVLKNGRRIAASNVREEGDKVKYETSAGELALPKSIVDHIERGGAATAMEPPAWGANLPATPSATFDGAAAGEIERGAVHGNAIDRSYIAKLENEASSGERRAGKNAALAHHAAAEFEMSRGDLEHALTDERTALTYAPEDPALMTIVGYLHLRRSEYRQSLDYLERARRVQPDNADVAKLEGWAYYGMNKLNQAVAEWKRSLALRPDPEVQAALDKAERDKQEEDKYRENESTHFTLRYTGTAEPALARGVLRTLEGHFSAIESELNFTPPDSIGVILYTQQAFADITRAPGLAPTWIQEGLAQWVEGKRSAQGAAALVQVYQAGQMAPLRTLEGSWMKLPGELAGYAYAWSLANIEYIVEKDGMGDMERILDRIGSGSSTEGALHDVLHSDYEELMKSTVEYLRKTYVR